VTNTRQYLTAVLGLIATLYTALSGAPIQIGAAENLQNLMDSKTMRQFEINKKGTAKGMGVSGNKWTSGMDPNSNYAMVWETHDSGSVLLNWLGTRLSYYRTERTRSGRNRDHVWAEISLTNEKKVMIVITVLVPHPSTEPLVATNVFSIFRKYRPPTLEVVGEKTYELKGAKGVLYESKLGRCTMVVDAAAYSLVNIEVEHCKDSAALVDVAQLLDFERLNRKHNS
jgi:hypothetical protein